MSTMNISRPVPSAVANLTIGAGLKTAVLNWDSLALGASGFEVWANTVDTLGTAALIATVTTNAFSLSSILVTTYFWVRAINSFGVAGVFSSSVLYTPGVITSADTENSIATGISSGVSAAASSLTIGSYGVWTSAGYAQFDATENSVVTVCLATTIDTSFVSGSGLDVLHRSRLYNVTLGQDVPAGTKVSLIYQNAIVGVIRGEVNAIVNTTESWVSGFRGLITGGHQYRLYTEVMKRQTFGTPTANVTIGSIVTASGAAAI